MPLSQYTRWGRRPANSGGVTAGVTNNSPAAPALPCQTSVPSSRRMVGAIARAPGPNVASIRRPGAVGPSRLEASRGADAFVVTYVVPGQRPAGSYWM